MMAATAGAVAAAATVTVTVAVAAAGVRGRDSFVHMLDLREQQKAAVSD